MTDLKGFRTRIWREEPEPDNPFAAKTCYCYGYDVYGQILQKASWFEYLYLLFKGERPNLQQAQLLERLAIALANPGPREASVRAAMNGGVGGSTHAASLMAALAVGAGQYGGSQEVATLVQYWQECKEDLAAWQRRLNEPKHQHVEDIWPPLEHAPGFDPHGTCCPEPVIQTLEVLSAISGGTALSWLRQHREQLERVVGDPLAMSGVAAAAFYDLGCDASQASMLYLMLRLPGAAAHALEQGELGWKQFPFYGDKIELTETPERHREDAMETEASHGERLKQ